jgi:hypothetical protein
VNTLEKARRIIAERAPTLEPAHLAWLDQRAALLAEEYGPAYSAEALEEPYDVSTTERRDEWAPEFEAFVADLDHALALVASAVPREPRRAVPALRQREPRPGRARAGAEPAGVGACGGDPARSREARRAAGSPRPCSERVVNRRSVGVVLLGGARLHRLRVPRTGTEAAHEHEPGSRADRAAGVPGPACSIEKGGPLVCSR